MGPIAAHAFITELPELGMLNREESANGVCKNR